MYIRGSSGAKLGDLRIVGTRRGMHMASRVPKTKLSGSKLEIYLASAFTFTRDILVDYSSLILANFQVIFFVKVLNILTVLTVLEFANNSDFSFKNRHFVLNAVFYAILARTSAGTKVCTAA